MKKTRKPDPRNKVAAKSTQRRAGPDAPPPADPSGNGNERVVFSKIRATVPLPNLIAVQRSSYDQFLQIDLLPEERVTAGLQAVFTSVFPFSDFRSACELHFVRYELGTCECKCGKLKAPAAPAQDGCGQRNVRD